MYTYTIQYDHITGPITKSATSPFELSIILDALLQDPHISHHTIKINTEER